MSTRNMVAPAGLLSVASVRAMTMQNPAPIAPLMKRLCPSITHRPFSRRAVVRRASGSEPAPGCGSVIPKQERVCPEARGAR